MPYLIVRNLNMARSTKVALSILMGMSFLTIASCILVAVELNSLSVSKDLTYDTARFMIWLALEHYVAIIAVSVPTIRPLALLVLNNRLKWFQTPSDDSHLLHRDRSWTARRPTRFTFGSESESLDGRPTSSRSRRPAKSSTEEPDAFQLSSLDTLSPKPDRALPIKKTVTVMRTTMEREEGDGFDHSFIDVSGMMRSSVRGPGGIKADSWSIK